MADEIKTITIDETVCNLNNHIIKIKQADYDSYDDSKKEKMNDLKNEFILNVEKLIEYLKSSTTEFIESEKLQKLVVSTNETSKLVLQKTMNKIDEIKNDEQLHNKLNETKENCFEGIHKLENKFNEEFEKVKENEKIKQSFDDLKTVTIDVTSKGLDLAKKSIDEFSSSPKVIQGVEKAKDTTIDVAQKAVDALKNWLRPNDDSNGENI